MLHDIKSEHLNFQAVIDLVKTFEIRNNDRDFHVHDTLLLREYNHDPDIASNFTGRTCRAEILFIQPPQTAPGVDSRYRILALGAVKLG